MINEIKNMGGMGWSGVGWSFTDFRVRRMRPKRDREQAKRMAMAEKSERLDPDTTTGVKSSS